MRQFFKLELNPHNVSAVFLQQDTKNLFTSDRETLELYFFETWMMKDLSNCYLLMKMGEVVGS